MSSNFILPDDFDSRSILASLTEMFGEPSFSVNQPESTLNFNSLQTFVDPLPMNEITQDESKDKFEDHYFLSFCTKSERTQKEIVTQMDVFRSLWDDTFGNNESSNNTGTGEQKKKIMRAPMINPPPQVPQKTVSQCSPSEPVQVKPKEETKQAKEMPVISKAPVVSAKKSSSKTTKPKKEKTKVAKEPTHTKSQEKEEPTHTKISGKGLPKKEDQQKKPAGPPSQPKYVIKNLIKPPSVPPKPPVKSSATAKVVGKLSMDKFNMVSKNNILEAPSSRSRLVRASGSAEGAQLVPTQEQEQLVAKPQQQIVRCTRKKGARPPSRVTDF